jgi:hypothetical protein
LISSASGPLMGWPSMLDAEFNLCIKSLPNPTSATASFAY